MAASESPRRAPSDAFATVGLMLVAAVGIALVRAPLFAAHARLKETSDVYVLPPPRETVMMSLGYRSAFADLLWAHVLVSQGLHTQRRLRFGNLIRLLDAINELEPTFRDPYEMADALITFQSNETPVDEVRKAREIMERGVQNRPLDAGLWLGLGEFVAFIAPGTYLSDPAEQARWRLEGARMLTKAADLAGGDANISWQTLGAVGILNKAGERDAAIRFLQRTIAITDDMELKEKTQQQLDRLVSEQEVEKRDDLLHRLDEGIVALRHNDLPFVSRLQYMVLGPPRNGAYCTGPTHAQEAACAPSWIEWERRKEAEREAAK